MSSNKKYGIFGTGALVSGAVLGVLLGSSMLRQEFRDPVAPEVAYEQIAPGQPGQPYISEAYEGAFGPLEDKVISEQDLAADYIAKNYPKAAALEILSDPNANIQYIRNTQDLKNLRIYNANTDSLLNTHDSLFYVQGNSLIGIDFCYTDHISEMVEDVRYASYFGITKTDSLKYSE